MTDSRPIFRLDRVPSPIGDILIVVDAAGDLRAVEFDDHAERLPQLLRRHGEVDLVEDRAPPAVRGAFERYFAGEVTALDTLPLTPVGTPFQRKVWAALRTIPAGETLSYGGLAARIGMPTAVRAVGLANGANPTPLVTPCHRVIGADGSLTGFGGGLHRKRWLLAHEGARFIDKAAAKSGRFAVAGPPWIAAVLGHACVGGDARGPNAASSAMPTAVATKAVLG